MGPMRMAALGLAIGLTAFFGVEGAVAQEEQVDHAKYEHRFVRITSARVHPDPVRLTTDQALAWVNYSPKIARVSFDREVAKKMACRSPGAFRLIGDRLESNDIQGRQFASLCKLAPGEYTYRVALFDSYGAVVSPPARMLEGTIVVE